MYTLSFEKLKENGDLHVTLLVDYLVEDLGMLPVPQAAYQNCRGILEDGVIPTKSVIAENKAGKGARDWVGTFSEWRSITAVSVHMTADD